MRRARGMIVATVLGTGLLGATPGAEAQDGPSFEVTITNLTRGQTFTPVLVASHRAGVTLFTLGHPPSAELATLAEEGDVAPLAAVLTASPDVRDVVNSGPPPGGFVLPGQSVALTIRTGGGFDHVSVAAMLIPTNDGFFAINGALGPRGDAVVTLFSPAYDAGSERNDELCLSIPGPNAVTGCGGPNDGQAPSGGEEGYVHIHAGIHGIGDLSPAERDWRNPVAQVVIRRLR
jgi:Spondin_N